MTERLTPAQYAERRGVSRQSVMKAIHSGRLTADSVVKTDRGWFRVDPDAADREWSEASDPRRQREKSGGGAPPTENPTPQLPGIESEERLRTQRVTQASEAARKTRLDADLRELELARLRGQTVDRKGVERSAFEVARHVRDAVMAVPERVAPELAAESDPQSVLRRLHDELAAALENLADKFSEDE